MSALTTSQLLAYAFCSAVTSADIHELTNIMRNPRFIKYVRDHTNVHDGAYTFYIYDAITTAGRKGQYEVLEILFLHDDLWVWKTNKPRSRRLIDDIRLAVIRGVGQALLRGKLPGHVDRIYEEIISELVPAMRRTIDEVFIAGIELCNAQIVSLCLDEDALDPTVYSAEAVRRYEIPGATTEIERIIFNHPRYKKKQEERRRRRNNKNLLGAAERGLELGVMN